jgi:hypothetical protein
MSRWKKAELSEHERNAIVRYGSEYNWTDSGFAFWALDECRWMRGRMRDLYDTGYGHYAYTRYSCEIHNMIVDIRKLPPVPLP